MPCHHAFVSLDQKVGGFMEQGISVAHATYNLYFVVVFFGFFKSLCTSR